METDALTFTPITCAFSAGAFAGGSFFLQALAI
jgi:hypothetical protein